MKADINDWLNEKGTILLEKVGIKKGQIVLDFGCGRGNYTLPAAKIVGDEGKVYAVDKDEFKLNELSEKAKSDGLNNIKIRKTSGELEFGFENDFFDVVLFYDIFWYFSLKSTGLAKLLKEAYRISKTDVLVSIYPEHTQIEKLKEEIEESGFTLQNKFTEEVFHEDEFTIGQILNFRKL